ncbi:hypothetical protein BgiMline_034108 [Biomphalaria glabrata]|nr:hypothetical protein BgiMline_020303 [Biomphalaria glabrata]
MTAEVEKKENKTEESYYCEYKRRTTNEDAEIVETEAETRSSDRKRQTKVYMRSDCADFLVSPKAIIRIPSTVGLQIVEAEFNEVALVTEQANITHAGREREKMAMGREEGGRRIKEKKRGGEN